MGRGAMRRDLAEFLPEMPWWDRARTYVEFYWWPTRGWVPQFSLWWAYNVRGFPKPPPMELDPVARHFGFAEGVPACMDGPVCVEHGWRLSPLVKDHDGGE